MKSALARRTPMSTKLTLRIDEDLIQTAKEYASQRSTSVSQVVSRYFELLSRENERYWGHASTDQAVSDLPPITASLWGVLEGKDVDVEEYHKHLEEKYL
jgi:hypothetical protein